ncbi:hypothetical protein [Streptomyces sp. NPDC055036]
MDGAWVLAVIGVVSGAVVVLNMALDHIPQIAKRVVRAVVAVREVKAAFKASDRE